MFAKSFGAINVALPYNIDVPRDGPSMCGGLSALIPHFGISKASGH